MIVPSKLPLILPDLWNMQKFVLSLVSFRTHETTPSTGVFRVKDFNAAFSMVDSLLVSTIGHFGRSKNMKTK